MSSDGDTMGASFPEPTKPEATTPLSFRPEVVLESLPGGFQAFDRQWRYVYVNARAEQMLGRSRHELLGKVCWDEFPEVVGTSFHARCLEAMEGSRPVVFEDFCPYEQIWVEFSLNPWAEGLAVFQHDITARRRAEQTTQEAAKQLGSQEARLDSSESLHASEERFRLLVEQVRDYAIFMLDPEGRVATWNAGAQRFKGYEADEIIGQHFSRFYTEEDVARGHPAHELEVATHEGRYQEEGWRVRKDGSQFWADVTITALRDADGALRGFAKVTRDVTERRASERARNIAQQLQEALQPEVPDHVPGLTVGRLTFPALEEASVGGDFYDVFPLDKDLYALVIGDVSGKGLAAAQQLALIRNSLRTTLYLYRTPGQAVQAVNAIVTAHDLLVGFVTCWVGVYDAHAGQIAYASCGHEPALVRRAGGTVEALESAGLPLGVSEIAKYDEGTVHLSAGDALLLYTDGLSEAGPNRLALLGTEGLARLLASLPPSAGGQAADVQEQAEELVRQAQSYAGGAFRDDVALLFALRR